eukprot:1081262-Amphidinium_carterae.2
MAVMCRLQKACYDMEAHCAAHSPTLPLGFRGAPNPVDLQVQVGAYTAPACNKRPHLLISR